jgi:hypothetical protein
MQILNNNKKHIYGNKDISNLLSQINNPSIFYKSYKKFLTTAVRINTKLLDKINLEKSKLFLKIFKKP